MDLVIKPLRTQSGNTKNISLYNPPKEIRDKISDIYRDFAIADLIRKQTYEEFDYRSLEDVIFDGQLRYNENKPSKNSDPSDAWKSDIVRPYTRNKIRAIISQVTQVVLYPDIVAQNDKDEEDRDMSEVMKDIVEYILESDNYSEKFVDLVTDMVTTPGVFVYQNYSLVKRKIKDIMASGDYEIKEVVDELYSGFKLLVVPTEDIYIGNIYEPVLQKQPFLVWSRIIDYTEAEAKYGHLDDFKFVEGGKRTGYDFDKDTFFNVEDEQLAGRLVVEEIYYNRSADLEIVLVNGVMVHGDPERPLQRKDKQYPFAFGGYERISSRFFYYKSLVENLKGIQDELDTMHRMVIDGTYLQIMPPLGVYGENTLDNTVFIPGSVHDLGADTQVSPINAGINLNAGISMLQKLEQEGAEVSAGELASGLPVPGDKTKFEIGLVQQNATIKLGLFGKRISFMVRDIGRLIVNCATQHMPFTEIMELTGGEIQIKFSNILLKDRNVDGRAMNRRIEFSDDFPISEEGLKDYEYDLLKKTTKYENGNLIQTSSIYMVNPEAFRRMKYLVKVEPDFISKDLDAQKKIAFYREAVRDQYANKQELFRNFVKAFYPGEEDRFVLKAEDVQNTQQPGKQADQLSQLIQ